MNNAWSGDRRKFNLQIDRFGDGCLPGKRGHRNYCAKCELCPLPECSLGMGQKGQKLWRAYRIKKSQELMGEFTTEEIAEELRVTTATVMKYQRISL